MSSLRVVSLVFRPQKIGGRTSSSDRSCRLCAHGYQSASDADVEVKGLDSMCAVQVIRISEKWQGLSLTFCSVL